MFLSLELLNWFVVQYHRLVNRWSGHSCRISASIEITSNNYRKGINPFHATGLFLYALWKYQKAKGFLMFSGSTERDQWHEMGLEKHTTNLYLNLLKWFTEIVSHFPAGVCLLKVNNRNSRIGMKYVQSY